MGIYKGKWGIGGKVLWSAGKNPREVLGKCWEKLPFHLQANKWACYCFVDSARRHKMSGYETKDVYYSWHSKLHVPLWVCILSPSHQISGDDTGGLKWMPAHVVCCIMGGTKFRVSDFYSNWKKAWYLSRGRHYLVLQGFWQQTQLWEMAQVKNTRAVHFWHIYQECAGVLRDHGRLTLPTQGTFS